MDSTPALPEYRDSAEREADLLTRLPALIARAMQAPGWAQRLHGVTPATITTRAQLAQLPLTRKSALRDLQAALPPLAGLNTTAPHGLRRLFVSPGPIIDPEGHGSDWWRFAPALRALGLQRGDLLHNCFSYHFTPAAFMVEGAAAALGCVVIPAGTGQTDLQVQAIASLRPSTYIGTPSFLKLILDKADASGVRLDSLQRALVSGEALPPSLRSELRARGIGQVLQLYASADLGCIAYETGSETGSAGAVDPGMVVAEEILLEIVTPGTGAPVQPGQVGEVVVTTFNADYPLIRFATGDLSAALPTALPTRGSTAHTNHRIVGWKGRADQSAKVRGMFVHPAQVAQVVRRFSAILRARLLIEGEPGADTMTLHCEVDGFNAATGGIAGGAALSAAVSQAIREETALRGEAVLVAPNSLPNDGKVIDDLRRHT